MSEQVRAQPIQHASALNPEAGSHTVTADPRELTAVERAGERSWSAWPYYAQRFGERGRRFTQSDSAWIATLPRSPVATVVHQVRWLGGLLAARGMPRLLLESHLDILTEELVAAVPERAAAYGLLRHAAELLKIERQSHMSDARLVELQGLFQGQLSGATDTVQAGVLIGAAVSDERAGLAHAVDSLVVWLTDPAVFSAAWAGAAETVVREARSGA